MRHRRAALVVTAVLAASCEGMPVSPADGGAPDGAMDAGEPTDACSDCAADADLGDHDTFATAQPLSPDAAPTIPGVIDPPGDLDYYTFEVDAGTWLHAFTIANPDGVDGALDTVLTLYDASMTRVAENDDSLPRMNPDSELLARVPAAGRYYLLVQDYRTWAGDAPAGMPSFTYDLVVERARPLVDSFTVDVELGDDAASARPIVSQEVEGGEVAYIAGELERSGDVDVFAFTVPSGAPSWLYSLTVMPSGPEGCGSTTVPAATWITERASSATVARADPRERPYLWPSNYLAWTSPHLGPSLAPGDYLLWIEHDGAALGANDFYVMKALRFGENPREVDDAANDAQAGAETLVLDDRGGARRGYLLSELGDGDVDHFAFIANDGEGIEVLCGSDGSGVRGLSVVLLDDTGSPVASAMERSPQFVIDPRALPAAGEYALRLTKGYQDPEIIGNWVRCVVSLTPPAP